MNDWLKVFVWLSHSHNNSTSSYFCVHNKSLTSIYRLYFILWLHLLSRFWWQKFEEIVDKFRQFPEKNILISHSEDLFFFFLQPNKNLPVRILCFYFNKTSITILCWINRKSFMGVVIENKQKKKQTHQQLLIKSKNAKIFSNESSRYFYNRLKSKPTK